VVMAVVMKKVLLAVVTALVGLVVFGVMLFLPAETFNYWQAWVFLAVFTLAMRVPSLYLSLKNPAALQRRMQQRRMQGGPTGETRPVQRMLLSSIVVLLPALLVFCALDHRFGWSPVPLAISLVGDALVALGLGLAMLAVIQNSYTAANVTVEAGQQLTTTGLYGFVRHPIYLGALLMQIGIPLALGSRWGLLVLIPGVLLLVLRILEEEQMLTQELKGYRAYTQKVQYRLLPYVW
jgi:protein-S-isoprenylcysteine O-methyltransferase Ste14